MARLSWDEREQLLLSAIRDLEDDNPQLAANHTLTEATSFAGDLEWDSLIVMDFVASVEDEFDILITMNMQAEIETVGQLVDAVERLRNEG